MMSQQMGFIVTFLSFSLIFIGAIMAWFESPIAKYILFLATVLGILTLWSA